MPSLPYLDWGLAGSVGGQLAPPGPRRRPGEVSALVDSLRRAASRAPDLVADVSGLRAGPDPVTVIVDRAGWAASMATTGQSMVLAAGGPAEPSGRLRRLGGQVLATQVGAVIAVLASRILGQFDPYSPPHGRLLLVAPNVAKVEARLGVNSDDFRLWVCLHEETHRLQFSHASWLPEHLLTLMSAVVQAQEGTTAELTRTLDTVTAVMSLVEGHADVMMDRAGTRVIPTLPRIRQAFEAHRDATGLAAVITRLLGLDAKRAQYRDGAAFCTDILARGGVDLLNQAFAAPENLPDFAEIHDPQRWAQRISR